MKHSIKNRLFFVIFIVLSFNIIIVLVFGNTFLERYYVHTKSQELSENAQQIKNAYKEEDYVIFYQLVEETNRSNTSILMYNSISGQYNYSGIPGSMGNIERQDNPLVTDFDERLSPMENDKMIADSWITEAINIGIFDKLKVKDEVFVESESDSLYLYTSLNEHIYLFLETPKSYISTTANTALRFFVYLSLGTLVIGVIAIYIVSSRIAKPIKEIDNTAKKIAAMDFSERCDVRTKDEIGALGNSVNTMADQLQKNINILKHDLEREEATNRMRREFVSNISHDFKTPLSLISAYTEALRDSQGVENPKKAYDIILEQSGTIDRLVNQLLTLNQLESGVMKYNMSFFSINELMRTVISNCRILLKKNNIDLGTDFNDEYFVKGDYTRITQVITNLLENAIKYVNEQKQIKIWFEEKGNMVRICLYNTHEHMDDGELKYLFDLFYRSDKSRTAAAKSYGVGLTIVKTIVEAHNGEVGVYNTKDGIVFWFNLEKFDFDDENDDTEGIIEEDI